ncbi:MAG: hypothetical protein ACI9SP_004113 [Arenicella sp.]|jgi:hypothetical protein
MLQTILVLIVALVVAFFGYSYMKSKGLYSSLPIEEQVEILKDLGLELNDGISIHDLLISRSREEYNDSPFDDILFVYGNQVEEEPWGRHICDRVWNFDLEAIYGDGSYVSIAKRFAKVAGIEERVTDIRDSLDEEAEQGWVSYKLDGEERKYEVKITDDWADPDVVALIVSDFKQPDKKFYTIDNGQAAVWFHLNVEQAKKLNELSGNMLKAI